MAGAITLKINGREDKPVEGPAGRGQDGQAVLPLPSVLGGASRSAGGRNEDAFLPDDYLVTRAVFDVGNAARSAEGGAAREIRHEARPDEVIVLELEDGGTLITSAQRLHDSLYAAHPGWWKDGQDDGSIPFEKLRAESAGATRGFAETAGGLVSKVFTLAAGGVDDAIANAAIDWLKAHGGQAAELGLTWLGTKAILWAVERQLFKDHDKADADASGWLYEWVGSSGDAKNDFRRPDKDLLKKAVAEKLPMLVFVHGTGSSSLGSFGELHAGDASLWLSLKDRFTGGVYAFEHRTLSASPIENALDLAKALPEGACISLVSHSRGGLVADLLCLKDFDRQIDAFKRPKNLPGVGEADEKKAAQLAQELDDTVYADQRKLLRDLAALLVQKRLNIQRYVRAASPANGTKLASGNFDLFLSGLLSLIGKVPFFFGNPYYSAFKRVVLEIAKNRTNPRRVPGIEAMLPDAPMAALLRDAPVTANIRMAIIAGDIEGGGMLKRLGVMLTDFLLFDREDNDLVVNTTAMLAGVAPRADARVLFDRGADVSHFRYFVNVGTRTALRDWLVCEDTATVDAFHPLPKAEDYAAALARASRDVAGEKDRPVVVILPGVMGSHLQVGGKDRVWFDPLDIAAGGLGKVEWGKDGVEAEALFGMFYGKLAETLAESHRVEAFPYDWRQPLDVLGERFGEFLDRLMKQTQQPIRLLAHSMGGLVVRACIHQRRPVMDALMAREGSRLIMLGTPNQGAHSMVANLIGKGDTLRTLVRLDVTHDMQEVLDIVAGFRGAMQLLPRPGFKDQFQGTADGGELYDFDKVSTWESFKPLVKDFWFGNGTVGVPRAEALESAMWLWRKDNKVFNNGRPALPSGYEKKSVYVFGAAKSTPCGVRKEGDRLRLVGTPHGDGTVSWESGRIGGIGQFFYMPAEHGDLPATKEYFPALVDLLTTGTTGRLPATPPASRAIEQAQPVSYDAGPPSADDAETLGRALLGGALRNRVSARPKRRLEVQIHAKDLRFLTQPVLVGHYAQDPIAGPERVIDRELLDGDLSQRYQLGLYAGPVGSATVVLRVPSEVERARGSLRGAVVAGLGPYDGSLSMSRLTEAVRAGALRFLLQVVDVLGPQEREVPLATLLIGYNSSANLTVEASVEALARGVMEANARFFETTRQNVRIGRLDIVELYIDTAITAVYALRQIEGRLAALAERQQTQLVCATELQRGEGRRQRLFDAGSGSNYWPRLVVSGIDDEQRRRAAAEGRAPGTLVAERLKFLYVGQRARAESVQLQRQPGLVERLVREQIHQKVWSDDFGRMLFQLMVPHDFKDAARQFEQLVLVVDETTANLPWELMLADDPTRTDEDKQPLAMKMAAVRQLATAEFRGQVRQNVERSALVVGNPSVKGFKEAFTSKEQTFEDDPPPLPGAAKEAQAVADFMKAMGYDTTPLVDGASAAQVLAALYRRPWRMLHVSAHGVFALPHPDGLARSGVVLSDGLLITAAEISAMEVVPELVFLNCCHLGKVDPDAEAHLGRQGNKLAASIATELIRIGVRCVVVAGWAVDDTGAQLFGHAFYEELLLRRKPFGEAVLQARRAVYRERPTDITWGAFQAYGDPSWRAEPRSAANAAGDGGSFASPEELLDELARIRANQARRADVGSDRDLRAQVEGLETMMKKRCPPGWRSAPQVQSALGATWLDLGEFSRARQELRGAVQAEDKDGIVPIHDIERLANVEARLAERLARSRSEAAYEAATRKEPPPRADKPAAPPPETPEELIESAIGRLKGLNELVGSKGSALVNPERSQLLGSAYKRKANLHATEILLLDRLALAKKAPADADAQAAKVSALMLQALNDSVEAYRRDEGKPGSGQFAAQLALNRLALDALTPWVPGAPGKVAGQDARSGDPAMAVELAKQCASYCATRYQTSGDPWDAVMQSDALMVELLIDGKLGAAGEAGSAAFEKLHASYRSTLDGITLKPREFDSIVSQMELLSRFCDALWIAERGSADAKVQEVAVGRWRSATRLLELRQRLRPGARPREDRPLGPKGEAAPMPAQRSAPPAAPNAAAKKAAAKKAAAKKAAAKKAAAKKAPAKKAAAKKAAGEEGGASPGGRSDASRVAHRGLHQLPARRRRRPRPQTCMAGWCSGSSRRAFSSTTAGSGRARPSAT